MSIVDTNRAAEYQRLVEGEWNDREVVAAWRKWHPKMAIQLQALTAALLEAARVRPGMLVLDLASGTGLPAIDLARAIGPTGRVTATDLSAGMLAVAEEQAAEAGVSNMAFQQADAQHLPFADATFDRVTSRIGAMYFVDIQGALGETRRVLRPGGRVALATWGPVENGTYAASLIGPFLRRVSPAPPSPDEPQPLRFAAEGTLGAELEHAGFREVEEIHRVIPVPWPGSPEELWQHFYDIAVPFHPLFDGLPPVERAEAVAEVVSLLRAHDDGGAVRTITAIVVASGVR